MLRRLGGFILLAMWNTFHLADFSSTNQCQTVFMHPLISMCSDEADACSCNHFMKTNPNSNMNFERLTNKIEIRHMRHRCGRETKLALKYCSSPWICFEPSDAVTGEKRENIVRWSEEHKLLISHFLSCTTFFLNQTNCFVEQKKSEKQTNDQGTNLPLLKA